MTDHRSIPCPECNGDGGFECLSPEVDRDTGAPQTYWDMCEYCKGAGRVWIKVEPITLEDLDDENNS